MNRTINDADDDDFELPKRGVDRRTDGRPDVRMDTRMDARMDAREDVYRDGRADDRELTLSTGTVLGLFFALALVCAVFFGFGYTTEVVAGHSGCGNGGCQHHGNRNGGRHREQADCRLPRYPGHSRIHVATRGGRGQSVCRDPGL